MNLKIDGKDYAVPMLNAADFEDYEELLLKVSDDKEHWIQRNKAAVGLIVRKLCSTYSDLGERQIKEAITAPKLWTLFGWVTNGKNGEAQLTIVESPRS